MPLNDDEIIDQIQNGNTEYADELVSRYYSSILRYCRWHCTDRWKAEDLTQETFYRVFRSIPGYVRQGNFRAYLYKTAYHLCIDEAGRKGWESLPESCRSSADLLGQVENVETVRCLLEKLTEAQREAVILRFGEEMSYREISKITGAPLRTVQSRIRLALRTLRKEKL